MNQGLQYQYVDNRDILLKSQSQQISIPLCQLANRISTYFKNTLTKKTLNPVN